jgi:hypothetical protein
MSTTCWTIIHHAASPVANSGGRVLHAVHHFVRPIAHHAARLLHHAVTVRGSTHTWTELICKVVPAALVGGGLLAPVPANPPQPIAPPVAPMAQPIPAVMPWFTPPEEIPWFPSPPSEVGSASPDTSTPEPPSVLLLLSGGGTLLLIRLLTRQRQDARRWSAGGAKPGSEKTQLVGRHPIRGPHLRPDQVPRSASEDCRLRQPKAVGLQAEGGGGNGRGGSTGEPPVWEWHSILAGVGCVVPPIEVMAQQHDIERIGTET